MTRSVPDDDHLPAILRRRPRRRTVVDAKMQAWLRARPGSVVEVRAVDLDNGRQGVEVELWPTPDEGIEGRLVGRGINMIAALEDALRSAV